MAHQIDTSKALSETRLMSGRRVIKTSVKQITEDNVVEVLGKALGVHELNRSEIDYLWKYYKGEQPIRYRTKDVRPEICNKIVENRANEIVSFTKRQADKEEQTIVQIGNRHITDAVETQKKANGYSFTK